MIKRILEDNPNLSKFGAWMHVGRIGAQLAIILSIFICLFTFDLGALVWSVLAWVAFDTLLHTKKGNNYE